MESERIIEYGEKYYIQSDTVEVEKLIVRIRRVFDEEDRMLIDCLAALCTMASHIAIDGDLPKGKLLNFVSEIYESLYNQMKD